MGLFCFYYIKTEQEKIIFFVYIYKMNIFFYKNDYFYKKKIKQN